MSILLSSRVSGPREGNMGIFFLDLGVEFLLPPCPTQTCCPLSVPEPGISPHLPSPFCTPHSLTRQDLKRESLPCGGPWGRGEQCRLEGTPQISRPTFPPDFSHLTPMAPRSPSQEMLPVSTPAHDPPPGAFIFLEEESPFSRTVFTFLLRHWPLGPPSLGGKGHCPHL